eukprot:CAMPEP_0184644378 /NCGR_PEP_ID=MMETSP0308-20130426/1104_1 /TAXON_ID=38269 /ORGANISM="Gloeochaete witrockiana, Strain SAG 46.84" /LENGTH=95 /DNA_ID=CAMNT_0027072873 /DNA_START=509 /DNA_END=796 /DNA_ORIENTATION=+
MIDAIQAYIDVMDSSVCYMHFVRTAQRVAYVSPTANNEVYLCDEQFSPDGQDDDEKHWELSAEQFSSLSTDQLKSLQKNMDLAAILASDPYELFR